MTVKVVHTVEDLKAVATVPGTILVDSRGKAFQYHPNDITVLGDWLEAGYDIPWEESDLATLFRWPATVVWEPLPEQFTAE